MKRSYRIVSYTKEELHEAYPEIAAAWDELINSDFKFYNYRRQYDGRYKKNGVARRVSLGTILEVLATNGYDVSVTVRKRKRSKAA